jgi:DNA invertase Pin-like site-specific DNA recombinase
VGHGVVRWVFARGEGFTEGCGPKVACDTSKSQTRPGRSLLFEAVVFYDLDRFGRNARQTMVALNTLADLGIGIWDYSTGLPVDLDSFEGEMMTFMKARFAQQYRDQCRKHTRDAMRQKAEQGWVTGNRIFGYDNVKVAKGQTTRTVNDAERPSSETSTNASPPATGCAPSPRR